MPGTLAALLMVVCYACSYVLLHKGHVEAETEDNGLFAVLLTGAVVLGAGAAFVLAWHRPGLADAAGGAGGMPGVSAVPGGSGVAAWVSKGWTSYGFAALSGVIGTLFGRMAVYAAIRRLGATRGIVLESAEILVTLVLAATLLHETLRPSDAAGVALLAAGITALIWERRMLHERHLWDNGVAFGVAGAILQGTGHFVRKWGMVQTTLPVVSAAVDLWAALLVYVVLLVSTGRLRTCARAVFSQPNPYLLAAGITSAAGVLLFFHAVQAVPVSVVAVTLGFEPLLVAAVSKLLFRDLEHITWLTWVYSAVVAAGIGIVQAR